MRQLLTPDICVIGAGSAGLTVAAAAAAFGVSVVLIEKKRMGGDCLNTGCVPSKALIAASRHAQAVREAQHFGVKTGEVKTDFAAVMAHVRGAIAGIEPNDSIERFTGLGVKVLSGEARFVDDRTVSVGDTSVQARRFVVATGSRPAVPPIPNLMNVPYLTNETIFDLKRLPGRLVIVGAGPMGLELAQAFHRLGSDVTVLEAKRALARDDPELSALLIESLRAEGVDIREGAQIARVTRRGRSGVRVTLEGDSDPCQIDATHFLIAASRRPDLDQLNLNRARIRHDDSGIKVNRRLRTRNPPRLRHRRCDRRRPLHALEQLSGGPRRPLDPLPLRRQDQARHPPLGHFHRPGACACGPERGRGAAPLSPNQHFALALRRHRSCAYRLRDARRREDPDDARRAHRRRRHPRPRRRRADRAPRGRRRGRDEPEAPGDGGLSLSDPFRGASPRRRRRFMPGSSIRAG